MRLTAAALTFAVGCASNTYRIPGSELQRLAMQPPETRGAHVRVVQQLSNADVGPPQPVTAETQIVIFPQPLVVGPERRNYYHYGESSGPVLTDHRGGGGS